MNRRILKLNRSIQKILMEYFIKHMQRKAVISIKEVSLSLDMKFAKVYISIMSDQNLSPHLYSTLEQERYRMQKAIAKVEKMKFCPRLKFFVNYVPLNPDIITYGAKTQSREMPSD